MFTGVIGDMVQDGSDSVRGVMSQFDVGPDLKEQVNTHQQPVPNVEQTCRYKSRGSTALFFLPSN